MSLPWKILAHPRLEMQHIGPSLDADASQLLEVDKWQHHLVHSLLKGSKSSLLDLELVFVLSQGNDQARQECKSSLSKLQSNLGLV